MSKIIIITIVVVFVALGILVLLYAFMQYRANQDPAARFTTKNFTPFNPPNKQTINGEYGKVVSYSSSQFVQFPDFKIRYIGEGNPKGVEPVMGNVQRFEVIDSSGTIVPVIWSTGTGVVRATYFSVVGKTFALELGGSLILNENRGRIPDGSILVMESDIYEKLYKQKIEELNSKK